MKNRFYDFVKVIFEELWDYFKSRTWNWRNILKKLFTKNLKEKIYILILSIFAFIYVQLQDVEERNLFVPLKIVKLDELTIVNNVPQNISLFVSGTRSIFNSLDVNKIIARVDLSDITDEGVYQRRPIIESLPPGIQVLNINPEELSIELSNLDKKILTVEPEIVDSPEKGFVVVSISVKPTKIWVNGPKDILNDITSLTTEPISIKDLNSDKEVVVGVSKNIHPGLGFDRDRKFTVTIDVEPEYQEIDFKQSLPVKVDFKDLPFMIENPIMVSNISFSVLRESVKNFKPEEDLVFFLDVAKVKEPGGYKLSIKYERLKEIKMKNYQPKTVNVFVDFRQEERKIFLEGDGPEENVVPE